MYFALFLIVFVVASPPDPCKTLCDFDKPNCTDGSWTKEGGDCYRYLHGGPRGDFCYHMTATASICPASGRPVRPSEVEGLIARRLGSGAGSLPIQPPSGDVRGSVAPPLRYIAPQTTTTTTTNPTTMPGDAIIAEIARIPPLNSGSNSGFLFDPIRGDQGLSLCIANSVLAFEESVSARDRWELAHGPALLGLARNNLDTRPVLVKPLLILVGHLLHMPRFDAQSFFVENGLGDFLTPENIATIQRFIVENHRAPAIYPQNEHQMLIEAYVAPLAAVMPSLMYSDELRHIVFEHRMLSHRFGIASPGNNPTFRIRRQTAFSDSIRTLLNERITRCTGVYCTYFIDTNGYQFGATSDWFNKVNLQIFNPLYGLFKPRESVPRYMEISPYGVYQRGHEDLYSAVGRFMGLALIQGNPIGLTFPTFFYARILGTQVTLKDVEEDEPALFNSMTQILSRSTDEELAAFNINFDGNTLTFTLENRDDLIRRKVNSLIDPEVEQSLNFIIAAFREMIPVAVTEGFTARALRDLIVGSSTFEVEDLSQTTTTTNPTTMQRNALPAEIVRIPPPNSDSEDLLQTTTTSNPTTMPGDAIIAEIARIPPLNRGISFNEWRGDQRLSLCVAKLVFEFQGSVSAHDRWGIARGPALLLLAQNHLDQRPVLIKPLLILVGHILQIPGLDPGRFLGESSLVHFFTPGNIETIQRFIANYHRGLRLREGTRYPQNEHQMLIEAYVAPLAAVMPSLMYSDELRHIVFEHRMLSHRFSIVSSRNNPTFEILRESAFADSFGTILSQSITGCTGVNMVRFRNEDGIGRGVVRDWFTEVSLQIFNPMLGLFQLRHPEQPNYLEISPLGIINANHELLYRAAGRFMGLAVIQGNPIGLTFPIIFYARILGTEVTLEEVEEDEPALFSSMNYIRGCQTEEQLGGLAITIHGEDSTFTLENRDDLIRRKVNSLIDPEVEQSLNWIIAAFREMIPVAVTEGFTPRALRDLIVGTQTFEVDDLMANAQFRSGYTRQSLQINWLESFLREMGPEDRIRFLRFCTSSTQLPIGGFANLANPFVIEKSGLTDSLPTSATCFNQLKLPPYETEEKLRSKLTIAINADSGMGNQ